MPTVVPGFWTRKIFIEVNEARAGYVRLGVRAPACFVIGKVVSTVAHDPVGFTDMT